MCVRVCVCVCVESDPLVPGQERGGGGKEDKESVGERGPGVRGGGSVASSGALMEENHDGDDGDEEGGEGGEFRLRVNGLCGNSKSDAVGEWRKLDKRGRLVDAETAEYAMKHVSHLLVKMRIFLELDGKSEKDRARVEQMLKHGEEFVRDFGEGGETKK